MKIGMSLVPGFEELYQKFANDPIGLKCLEIEGIAPDQLDSGLLSDKFFNEKLANIATDTNSNWTENTSPAVYRTFTSNGQLKLLGYHMIWYYANKRYGKEFADEAMSMIWDGRLYYHDAHGLRIQIPYCYAFSLDKLVFEGRPYGSSPNTPPKHRKSFVSQVDKLISDMSKQFAGATAPSDFFLWYAWYCKKEGLDLDNPEDIDKVVQDMQGLVCLFNDASRAEGEPPFTNISIYDHIGLNSLFGHITYPDHTKPNMEYIMKLQRVFCEWFSHGDPITGFPYRFPVVTQNMTTDDDGNFVDEEHARWVAAVNCEKGNFNLHFGKKNKLAMCCRYENDIEDMDLTPDSFGNGGVNIGSHRVITPNFPRAAIMSGGNIEKFVDILDRWFDITAKLLHIHRVDILQKRIDRNPEYLQYFGKLGWFSLDTMFSTFGVTGIYEAVKYMGYDILDDDGTEFALDLMKYIKGKCKYYRGVYNCTFNAEEIPGEQACVTLRQKDGLMYKEHDFDCELYSNQYIPLINDADMLTRIDLSGRFMKMISGGGIVHANAEAPIDTAGKMYEIMKFAAKSGVPHIAVCYRFGKCVDHKATIIGQGIDHCPICGKPIVHTRARVIGYFSDEFNWNPVRQIHDAPNRHYAAEDEIKQLYEEDT